VVCLSATQFVDPFHLHSFIATSPYLCCYLRLRPPAELEPGVNPAKSRIRIAVLLVLSVVVFWRVGRVPQPALHSHEPQRKVITTRLPQAGQVGAVQSNGNASGPPPVVDQRLPNQAGGSFTEQRVFRLVADGGVFSLQAVEDLKGDFRKKRQLRWEAGMLCCRLLDARGNVLAEDTFNSPDYVCLVLDPNVPENASRPVRYTPDGPVVFQVRFPQTEGATRLNVYRLAGQHPPAQQADPPGKLLAAISLP
jgi:hypothetical protein